jgi:hypothetical protein
VNPDRIYRQYRDEALAKQITADKYSTFVAMPFDEHFSYRSRQIYNKVIQSAAERASKRGETCRQFYPPRRIDEEPGVAGVITEDIIVRILESHLFLADLTFENPGVILEVGVALGLKPNSQIILILQGDPSTLHFDIRSNRVIRYDQPKAINNITSALIAGARAFESDCKQYIQSITQTLSSDATLCLNWYGRMCRDHPRQSPSLHRGSMGPYFQGDDACVRFDNAARELLGIRLIWSDYKVGTGVDKFGMHATELGWSVIEHMWSGLSRTKDSNKK